MRRKDSPFNMHPVQTPPPQQQINYSQNRIEAELFFLTTAKPPPRPPSPPSSVSLFSQILHNTPSKIKANIISMPTPEQLHGGNRPRRTRGGLIRMQLIQLALAQNKPLQIMCYGIEFENRFICPSMCITLKCPTEFTADLEPQ